MSFAQRQTKSIVSSSPEALLEEIGHLTLRLQELCIRHPSLRQPAVRNLRDLHKRLQAAAPRDAAGKAAPATKTKAKAKADPAPAKAAPARRQRPAPAPAPAPARARQTAPPPAEFDDATDDDYVDNTEPDYADARRADPEPAEAWRELEQQQLEQHRQDLLQSPSGRDLRRSRDFDDVRRSRDDVRRSRDVDAERSRRPRGDGDDDDRVRDRRPPRRDDMRRSRDVDDERDRRSGYRERTERFIREIDTRVAARGRADESPSGRPSTGRFAALNQMYGGPTDDERSRAEARRRSWVRDLEAQVQEKKQRDRREVEKDRFAEQVASSHNPYWHRRSFGGGGEPVVGDHGDDYDY